MQSEGLVGAVILFAGALLYGVLAWRKRRSPAMDRLRDCKTEELQQQPDPDENASLAGR